MFVRRGVLLTLALAPFAAATATPQETPFGSLGIEKMSELATQVVAGTVERTEGEWNHDRSHIQTRVTLLVERVLAGQAGERLVFRIPGGTVGETTIIVTDIAEFHEGEEVLVFLRGTRGRMPTVLGGPEGKLPLSRADDGELALMFPIPAATSAFPEATSGTTSIARSEPIRLLDDLERLMDSFAHDRARR